MSCRMCTPHLVRVNAEAVNCGGFCSKGETTNVFGNPVLGRYQFGLLLLTASEKG